MGKFFDPDNLTPEQAARWQHAVDEYNRVIDANITNDINAMSEEDRAIELAEARAKGDMRSLHEIKKSFNAFFGGGAGNVKSALFARLLDSIPALPFPPPLAFGYPWYSIIETREALSVMVGGISPQRSPDEPLYIIINQSRWTVVSTNAAADQLVAVQKQLRNPEVKGYQWTPELYKAAMEAYSQKPSFTVRNGRWPNFTLSLGRNRTTCNREYLLKTLSNHNAGQVGARNNVQPFDVGRFYLNHEIGETDSHNPAFCIVEFDDWELVPTRALAPFSPEEVARLNAWQTKAVTADDVSIGQNQLRRGHPFTCPNQGEGVHTSALLVAQENGWACPHCSYMQNWAHPLMLAP